MLSSFLQLAWFCKQGSIETADLQTESILRSLSPTHGGKGTTPLPLLPSPTLPRKALTCTQPSSVGHGFDLSPALASSQVTNLGHGPSPLWICSLSCKLRAFNTQYLLLQDYKIDWLIVSKSLSLESWRKSKKTNFLLPPSKVSTYRPLVSTVHTAAGREPPAPLERHEVEGGVRTWPGLLLPFCPRTRRGWTWN